MSHIQDRNLDIVIITETWLSSASNDITSTVKDYSYVLNHMVRQGRGGGVGVISKQYLELKRVNFETFETFEYYMCTVRCYTGMKLLLIAIYRLQKTSVVNFINELHCLLTFALSLNDSVVISGDINIHMDVPLDPSNTKLLKLIDEFGLKQHVKTCTHRLGHTLDCVITSECVGDVCGLQVDDLALGDHFLISFTVNMKVYEKEPKQISFRRTKAIDVDAFSNDLTTALPSVKECLSFEDAAICYNSVLRNVVDKHAPVITKVIKVVPTAPWFDTEYILLRRKRRQAERIWKKSGLSEDRMAFIQIRKETTTLARCKKKVYYSDNILKSSKDQKGLFNFLNKFNDSKQDSIFPCHENKTQLANDFNSAFTDKTRRLHDRFITDTDCEDELRSNQFAGDHLTHLKPTDVEELREIILESGVKCSGVDPLPVDLTKDHLDNLLPIWCHLINLSLSEGSIDGIKLAEITPKLKDISSNHEQFGNYRPISNLCFVGKLAERVVLRRLNEHMTHNSLHIDRQSGYKKHHSTETLLVKITNDLLVVADKKSATVMLLLDLSAAFDTVDHKKLLDILFVEIGIRGTALKWFKSFLTKRKQKVRIGDTLSEEVIVEFGVPQGSVLGPVLFNIYIRSIYNIMSDLGFKIEGYADDHQVYKGFSPIFQVKVLAYDINRCFSRISDWMKCHFLCLNPAKTQIMVLGSDSVLEQIGIHGVVLDCGTCIRFKNTCKNLGVHFDSGLTFDAQITSTVFKCTSTLRKLYRMKFYLDTSQKKILTCALILSTLDYCNSLYYGINKQLINKLQSVQNSAARLIFGRRKHDSTSDLLKNLHWLRVEERVSYKLILLVFKCINAKAPSYLSAMIQFSGSHVHSDLIVSRSSTHYGDRSFVHAGPKLWNSLPKHLKVIVDINVFKRQLKGYLFNNYDQFMQRVRMR